MSVPAVMAASESHRGQVHAMGDDGDVATRRRRRHSIAIVKVWRHSKHRPFLRIHPPTQSAARIAPHKLPPPVRRDRPAFDPFGAFFVRRRSHADRSSSSITTMTITFRSAALRAAAASSASCPHKVPPRITLSDPCPASWHPGLFSPERANLTPGFSKMGRKV